MMSYEKNAELIKLARRYQHLNPLPKKDPPTTEIGPADLIKPVGKISKALLATARAVNLPKEALVGDCRKHPLIRYRQCGHFVAYMLTGASLPMVGKIFKRDHSTVLHSLKAVEKRLLNGCEETRAVVEAIKAEYRQLEDA